MWSGTPVTEATFPVRGGPDLTLMARDAFVAKVSADGAQLVYAGYIGGSDHDFGNGIAVDNLGQAYVSGKLGRRKPPSRCAAGRISPLMASLMPLGEGN